MKDAITIRRSTDSDLTAMRRLAALDDKVAPAGEALLAFVNGELRAALPLGEHARSAVADPFAPTADLVDLLRLRAEQEERGRRSESRGQRVRARPKSLRAPAHAVAA